MLSRRALGPSLVGDLDEAGGAGREGVLGADPVGGGPAGGVVTEDGVGVGEGGEPGQVVGGLVDLDRRAEELGQPGSIGSVITRAPLATASKSRLETKPSARMASWWSLRTTPAERYAAASWSLGIDAAADHLVGDQAGPEVAVHRQREAGRERVAHDRAELAARVADEQHRVAGVGSARVGVEPVRVGGLQQRLDAAAPSRGPVARPTAGRRRGPGRSRAPRRG